MTVVMPGKISPEELSWRSSGPKQIINLLAIRYPDPAECPAIIPLFFGSRAESLSLA
jgi:hypothetical protein